MRVLVVNAGSNSLHLTVLDAPAADGDDTAAVPRGDVLADEAVDAAPDSDEARQGLASFLDRAQGVEAVGHRIVHGGPRLREPALLDDDVLAALDEAADLAPLHVPPALAAVDAVRAALPDVPQVACFDTAFHADLPVAARTYALPADWREQHGLRRYGFHGLSYAYAVRRAAQLLGRPLGELQLLVAHLGSGCSAAAVRGGRSVDTTMGFTPLEGLVMGSRSGTVDPGLVLWLQRHGRSLDAVEDGLEHGSGLVGLAGRKDTRELVAAAAGGDGDAALALDVFALGARRGLAAVAASLDRVDALVLTGEIGWDQPEVREAVAGGLGVLGVRGGLRPNRADDGPVSPPGATVPVLAVRPREDLSVAADVVAALRDRAD